MENNINVLLLLSHEQKPPPDIEMRKLAEICKKEKETFFATTRNISSLSSGAEVAFYGSGKGHYFILATAKFIRFIPDDNKDYLSILSRHELYATKSNRPNRMVGLVHLADFDHFPSGKSLECLDAWLDNGRALKEEEILAQGIPSSVYYIKAPGNLGICKDDQIRLYEATKQEGRTKIMADRRSGEMEVDIHYELDGNIKGFGDRFWTAMSAKHEGVKKLLKSSASKVGECPTLS